MWHTLLVPHLSEESLQMRNIYTGGRGYGKSQRHKFGDNIVSVRVGAIVDTVLRRMRAELSQEACLRWCRMLNKELGSETFKAIATDSAALQAASVPRAWRPAKPKLTLALIDAFARWHSITPSPKNSPMLSTGAVGLIEKIMARHIIELMREEKGLAWLQTCGEIAAAQLEDTTKLNHVLARSLFDLLFYVHARAVELASKDGSGDEIVLLLHNSDQTLGGKAMRGCGVVCCEAGRRLFANAMLQTRNELVIEH